MKVTLPPPIGNAYRPILALRAGTAMFCPRVLRTVKQHKQPFLASPFT